MIGRCIPFDIIKMAAIVIHSASYVQLAIVVASYVVSMQRNC